MNEYRELGKKRAPMGFLKLVVDCYERRNPL